MDLKDYLTATRQSLRSFAKVCEVSPATMMRVSKKSVTPSRRLMERIYKETDRLVAPCDLIGLSCAYDETEANNTNCGDPMLPRNSTSQKEE